MIARPVRRPGPIPFTPFNTFPSIATAPAALASGLDRQPPAPTRLRHAASAQAGVSTPHATFHGHGVLCVRSSASGRLYRFQGHGAILEIDPRDALLLGRLTDVHVG